MRYLAPVALAALALPAALQAQAAEPMPTYDPDRAYALDDEADAPAPLAERLADPARQEQLAATIAVLGEVLLDMPLAPLVEPMAEAAGRDPRNVDPDLTLRKMAPGASDVPARLARELPRAMDTAAAMADGIAAMQPALRAMADRLEQAARDPR